MSLLSNPWLNVGMGLLANSGPSLTPVNPWRGIGQGLMAASDAKAMEAQQAYESQRMAMEQQKMAQEQQRQTQLQSFIQSLPPDQQMAASVDPSAFVKAQMEQRTTPVKQQGTAGQFSVPGIDPNVPGTATFVGGQLARFEPTTVSQGASAPSSIQEYNLAKEQGYTGTFQQWTEMTGTKNDVSPYYTPVYTDEGVMAFNNRSGMAAPLMGAGGAPLVRATDSPELQGQITGERKRNEVAAEAQATAQIDLPRIESSANQTIGLVKALRDHPGMPAVVGVPDLLSAGGRVPATEGADFRERLDQVKGQQFLQAYQTLKGSGQITEIEGNKAEKAIARMGTAQSEKAFKAAADDFIEAVESGIKRARQKAGAVTNDGWSIKVKK
jgi:hypothetical protein